MSPAKPRMFVPLGSDTLLFVPNPTYSPCTPFIKHSTVVA
uniref:Uncharacterized protein n=1 Tax=virus sp. ctBM815 TaxID=2825806 RepID=A0A8S5RLA8_9VIRU|nr:MAG TPA: hypothetical protein [virus sp. ctBM815]